MREIAYNWTTCRARSFSRDGTLKYSGAHIRAGHTLPLLRKILVGPDAWLAFNYLIPNEASHTETRNFGRDTWPCFIGSRGLRHLAYVIANVRVLFYRQFAVYARKYVRSDMKRETTRSFKSERKKIRLHDLS